jgi:hypothetical protein
VVLARTEERERINAAWPNAQVVLGDLEDVETPSDEASKANVVLGRLQFFIHNSNNSNSNEMNYKIADAMHLASVKKCSARPQQAQASSWVSDPYFGYKTLGT